MRRRKNRAHNCGLLLNSYDSLIRWALSIFQLLEVMLNWNFHLTDIQSSMQAGIVPTSMLGLLAEGSGAKKQCCDWEFNAGQSDARLRLLDMSFNFPIPVLTPQCWPTLSFSCQGQGHENGNPRNLLAMQSWRAQCLFLGTLYWFQDLHTGLLFYQGHDAQTILEREHAVAFSSCSNACCIEISSHWHSKPRRTKKGLCRGLCRVCWQKAKKQRCLISHRF